MERREDPGTGAGDDRPIEIGAAELPRAGPRPFARFVASPAARKLVLSRIGRAGLGLAVLAVVLIFVGLSLSKRVVAWLHGGPAYRLDFGEIVLDPAPPGWIRGGKDTILEEVRAGRDDLRSISMPDIDLDALLTDFRRNPRIARADRATRAYPNRVTVHLEYREPVAVVQADPKMAYPIDRGGVVLPVEGTDLDRAGHLAKILATAPRVEPSPGIEWPADVEPGDRGSRVLVAARLAGFFKDRVAEEPSIPADLRPTKVFANDPGLTGLVVALGDQTYVLWTRFQARPPGDEPSDLEKWRRLVAWSVDRKPAVLPRKEYLFFTRDGVDKGRFRASKGDDDP